MKALISGQAGLALLIDDGKCWSVSVEEPDLATPCAQEEFQYLLSGSDDVVSMEATTADDARAELQRAWCRDRALQMTLILLDREEETEIREMAAECLEERLSDPSMSERLLNRLCESPLPDQAGHLSAVRLADAGPFPRTASLLAEVVRRQPAVYAVCVAFEDLDDGLFAPVEFPSRAHLRRWLSDHGVFRRLAREHGTSIGNEVLALLADSEIKRLPAANKFFSAWIAPLKKPLPETPQAESEGEPSRRVASRPSMKDQRTNHERWQLAERQIGEILGLFDRGEDAKALQWSADLVQRQTDADDGPYAVQSLSNLAIAMKQRGRQPLQLHFAKQAARSEFADAQACNQYADAMLANHEPAAALQQYDETIRRFDSNVVARNGRAEVLRELNRLEEALQQYDETIRRFDSDVFAQCGRAEVLRELNRLDDALRQYDETIRRFDSNEVARNGRAEVLRELNLLEDALQQYDETIRRFDSDVFAQCGRAEVLRELNRLDDALRQYDETIRRFDSNEVARNGRAEVLRELNLLEDALQQYDETIRRFDSNVVARNGRAEVLRELNRLEEALQQYDETIRRFDSNEVARNGRAEVLRELNLLEDALQQYDETIRRFNSDVVAQCGRAEVLRELNRLDEALSQIQRTLGQFPHNPIAQTACAVILMELQQYDVALAQLEPLLQESRVDWVAFHVRGMILLRKGELDKAADLFQRGMRDCPLPSQKAYFRNALAAVRLKQQNAAGALEAIAGESGDVADVIRMHAFGEEHRLAECTETNNALRRYPGRQIAETRELLEAGYLSKDAAVIRTPDWHQRVFQKECRLLLRFGTRRLTATGAAHSQSA